jgi:hypothetical protein
MRQGVAPALRGVPGGLPVRSWPKCDLCPLYDPGWAAESYAAPASYPGGTVAFEDPFGLG